MPPYHPIVTLTSLSQAEWFYMTAKLSPPAAWSQLPRHPLGLCLINVPATPNYLYNIPATRSICAEEHPVYRVLVVLLCVLPFSCLGVAIPSRLLSIAVVTTRNFRSYCAVSPDDP